MRHRNLLVGSIMAALIGVVGINIGSSIVLSTLLPTVGPLHHIPPCPRYDLASPMHWVSVIVSTSGFVTSIAGVLGVILSLVLQVRDKRALSST